MTALFWHRRDLRVADNVGLGDAARDGHVVPAFVLDDDALAHAGPPRVAFLLAALRSLRDAYRKRGGDLLVARGDPVSVLPRLAAEYGADRVVWNQDYSGLARRRDRRVREALRDADREVATHHDALHHEPGTITTNAGDHYSVFSYFWEKWRDRPKADAVDPPSESALADVAGGTVPDLSALDVDPPEAEVPAAGTGAARERLDAFCDGPIYRYDEARDYPARGGTSRLSPHLKFGTVGVREVYAATASAARRATDDDRAGVTEFRRQLAWREFYAHALAARPDIVAENYREYERPIEWRDDPAELRAWKNGETGYPLVDAAMRQLRAEAFVHNRARMVAAAFLTTDLLVDWRRGYEWFRRKLVDHDPASEAGGWQWAASTGMDAQPYFRVFNPATQAERFDPDGEYVRAHVPELRGVDASVIHEWPSLDAEDRAVAPDYAAPIVDHAERREAAIAAFERARGDG